jgi:hypothetical protein
MTASGSVSDFGTDGGWATGIFVRALSTAGGVAGVWTAEAVVSGPGN